MKWRVSGYRRPTSLISEVDYSYVHNNIRDAVQDFSVLVEQYKVDYAVVSTLAVDQEFGFCNKILMRYPELPPTTIVIKEKSDIEI